MSITRLSGGLTPADGSDPRTFPVIFNDAADLVEQNESDITALDGRVTTAEGNITTLQQGFRFVGQRRYTSSGSFSKADPLLTGASGLKAVRVTVVAGGGSAGGAEATGAVQVSVGAGGGGGGAAQSFILASALGASETVTVGAGGAGATSTGNSGTSSVFGTVAIVSANGGSGGESLGATAATQAAFRNGGSGGTTLVGDIVLPGSAGGHAVNLPQDIGNASSAGAGGHAGGGFSGERPSNRIPGVGAQGQAGLPFGGGSSGPGNRASAAARTSEAAADGIVIIDCFV
jgi:hypothetical protein